MFGRKKKTSIEKEVYRREFAKEKLRQIELKARADALRDVHRGGLGKRLLRKAGEAGYKFLTTPPPPKAKLIAKPQGRRRGVPRATTMVMLTPVAPVVSRRPVRRRRRVKKRDPFDLGF